MANKVESWDPIKLLLGALLAGLGVISIHSAMRMIGEATSGKKKDDISDLI
jgi:hypothetical protein